MRAGTHGRTHVLEAPCVLRDPKRARERDARTPGERLYNWTLTNSTERLCMRLRGGCVGVVQDGKAHPFFQRPLRKKDRERKIERERKHNRCVELFPYFVSVCGGRPQCGSLLRHRLEFRCDVVVDVVLVFVT